MNDNVFKLLEKYKKAKTIEEKALIAIKLPNYYSLEGVEHWNNYSLNDIKGEKWKPIISMEIIYEISNMGRVKRLQRETINNNGKISLKEKIMATGITPTGYPQITLTNSGIRNSIPNHIIVFNHFNGIPEFDYEINHIDGNKKNSCCWNLEGVTHAENMALAGAMKLSKQRGETSTMSKLTDELVLDIYNNKKTCKELAVLYNIAESTIANIRTGKTWKHLTGKKYNKKWLNLTDEQIIDIFLDKGRCIDIAKKYGITREHAGRIRLGKYHGELTKPYLKYKKT